MDDILNKSRELYNGLVLYDLGCGLMGASLSFNDFNDLISNISGSTNPNQISNDIANTINQSVLNADNADNNKETINDNFFTKLINIITQKLAEAVTTAPQIRTILAISDGFKSNGEIKIKSVKESLEDYKVYLNCIIKNAMEIINKFIYDFIIPFLIKLVTPVISKVIKEKTNQYKGVIKSLTSVK